MKIVVHNHVDQYALSRQQVEVLRALLPPTLWSKVSEFHLCDDHRRSEAFEYDKANKIVFFSYPVQEKTPEIIENAVRELLIGLARVRNDSEFFVRLRQRERETYTDFIEEWLPKCLKATTRK
jgi:hypothetical protein